MSNRFPAINGWLKRLYREGARFHEYSRALEKSSRLSGKELTRFQEVRLREMVRHCARNIPYYQDLFRELGLEAEDIRTAADLHKLPLLEKKTVQDNFDKFIDKRRYNMLCRVASTSGTTGMPARFVRDFDAINFEHAAVWRQWRRAGDDGLKRISLRGGLVVPSEQSQPPFWKYDPVNRELQMSSYHLSQENSLAYIGKIVEFQPRVLYCGPSMGFVLAKFFNYYGVKYTFDMVFTSSESLEPDVRRYIEETFSTRIHDWYGQAERVAAIGQCPYGNYHIQEDYSLVELIESPQAEDGYEIVGSQFCNKVMPLLRYRTEDFVQTGANALCPCGSAFRTVEKIIGRSYGYLMTPEGYSIAITTHIPCGIENLIEVQFYQEKPEEVVLNVISNGELTDNDKERLVTNTRKYTSPQMNVIVREVRHIPRGPNGKFVNIISKVGGRT